MVESSVPQGTKKHPPSTREIRVDARYAKLLAEDLGCKESTARTCFEGEPCKRTLGVVAWAFEHAPDSPEKRSRMILAWAKRRRAGAFRGNAGDLRGAAMSAMERDEPDEDRAVRLARTLAAMWVEHPESLAEAIRALERNRDGNGRS